MPNPHANPILIWPVLAALALTACSQPSPTETATVNVSPARQPPPTGNTGSAQATTQDTPVAEPAQAQQPTTPVAAPDADDTEWWLRTPEPVEGRVRIVASATAASLIEARQQAVANARDLLARSLGTEPDNATIERTSAEQGEDKSYTAWVLISAPSN